MSESLIEEEYVRAEALYQLRELRAAQLRRARDDQRVEARSFAERLARHYQQAIDMLTAAPMPDTVRPAIDRAAAILRARGIDATAGLDSVAVASDGHPTYLVRGIDREHWRADRIADDIERIEQAKMSEVKP